MDNQIRILKNSGPIGLSFMIVLSKSCVQILEHKGIAEALTLNLAPKTYKRYVNDTHARFKSKEQSCEFQKTLNKQDKHVQFTIQDENEEKSSNFLDVKIKNNNSLDTKNRTNNQKSNTKLWNQNCLSSEP